MFILITLSVAVTVGLLVFLIVDAMPTRPAGVKTRIVELGLDSGRERRRSWRDGAFQEMVIELGGRLENQSQNQDWSSLRQTLACAGYRQPSAVPLYLGVRLVLTLGLALYGFIIGSATDVGQGFPVLCALLGAGFGWIVPRFLLMARVTRRQKEIRKALPDAADLLVICVEAGLGLNQALVRVADEIRHRSALLAEELALTNVSIRAGTPRDQALNDWAMRTGVDDVRSLATMMVQTERFGTSIAHSLRVHAESMRSKRRQRAEEAAAKTTIKMVFPLALCIFPALFVVILGPAFIDIISTFSTL